ncbi:MCE family protein [Nocardioides terrisoli]|uniref:MCE family protein n=1 Tax=Nocardioides terrisoli TaxID=3388267 RepID=UPI00287BC13A|nr:MCE family protein [Nocardioides marmorisolisilvae]
MARLKSLAGIIAGLVVIAIVVAVAMVVTGGGGRKYVVADFPRAIALYKGSDVRILGLKVGQVDSVTPMGTKVRVKFEYDDKYKVPANAKAVVISPSIVGDRFVQLTPAYQGGPVLPNNAHLGLDRTATPLELDEIFGSLNQLNLALGPKGANRPDQSGTGALTRLLDSTARNFGGQGVEFNKTLKNLGRLTQTLSDNKDELFGSASEVEKFVNALARNDKTVRQFADSLASGSQLLANDRHDLGRAVDNLSVALKAVRGFVHDNRKALHTNVDGLTRISNTLVKRRSQLDEILHVGPLALNNLALTYDPNSGTEDTRDNIGEILSQIQDDPAGTLCKLLNLSGLTKGGITCPSTASPRTAPFGASKRSADPTANRFDPTLAGLVGVAR